MSPKSKASGAPAVGARVRVDSSNVTWQVPACAVLPSAFRYWNLPE